MIKKNQNGFGHIGLILIVVVVLAAVGLVGWGVLNKSKSNTSTSSTPNETAPDDTQTDASGKIDKIETGRLKFHNPDARAPESGPNKGPYYHDIYTASSTDGVHFTSTGNKISAHSSVPDVIKLPSGQLVFYAVDGMPTRSRYSAMLGVSDDNGKTWKLGSVDIKGEQGGVADPQILMTDDGRLRMYYTGGIEGGPGQHGQDPEKATAPFKIQSAVSSDGINFTKEPGDRFSLMKGTDPDVIKIGETWFMYVSQGPTEVYATSSSGDGIFAHKGEIANNGSVSKTIKQGELYRQFYCNNQGGISSRTSSDGISWSDAGVSLSKSGAGMICDPSPVQIGPDNWLMVYKVASD